jgi:prepilin-type N-terminal cleavage/methylation domain-containing protein
MLHYSNPEDSISPSDFDTDRFFAMRQKRQHLGDRRGFTLIELLTVITILAVLAALLFPAMSNVMDRSKAAACVMNLRQIAVACGLYAGENNGSFPGIPSGNYPEGGCGFAGGFGNNAPSGPRALFELGYAKDIRMFFCPAEKKPLWFADVKNAWGEPVRGGATYVGYRFFAGMANVAGASQDITDQMAQRAMDPSSRILPMDICNGAPIPGAEWSHTRAKPAGGNILFNDGSVQWRKASEMSERYIYVNRSYYW